MLEHIIIDTLRNSVLITGLVIVMMMMIESLNIESKGAFFAGLRKSRIGGVLVGAFMGAIPGCMGGFATVSLYSHNLLSFGALIAMMIASSGDEAFVMMATIPGEAMQIFVILFCIAVVIGVVVDLVVKPRESMICDHQFAVHEEDSHPGETHEHEHRHYGWKRIVMIIGVAAFIAALGGGMLEHDHDAHAGHSHEGHNHGTECCEHHHEHGNHQCCEHHHHGDHCCDCQDDSHEHGYIGSINLLSESWMNMLFACLSLIMLGVLIFGPDHFVEEHLWEHIIVKHLPVIFGWTFGVLLATALLLNYFDISQWISDNTILMILLATAVGIIPESGPHMIFVTLYASGIVPLPVLLASCISQDGHASLPLLAESKSAFIKAKLINCAVALGIGFAAMLFV